MSECPVHSSDEAAADRSGGEAIRARWDLIFLGMAMGMLALILAAALPLP